MAAVLALVGEVATSGLCGLDISVVPRRRLDELLATAWLYGRGS